MRFGFVICNAFSDGGWGDIECSGDGGSTSHVGNSGFAGKKTSNGEVLVADAETGFGAFAIELGLLNTKVGIRRSTISDGLGSTTELCEIGIVRIVAVEHNGFGVHAEQS